MSSAWSARSGYIPQHRLLGNVNLLRGRTPGILSISKIGLAGNAIIPFGTLRTSAIRVEESLGGTDNGYRGLFEELDTFDFSVSVLEDKIRNDRMAADIDIWWFASQLEAPPARLCRGSSPSATPWGRRDRLFATLGGLSE